MMMKVYPMFFKASIWKICYMWKYGISQEDMYLRWSVPCHNGLQNRMMKIRINTLPNAFTSSLPVKVVPKIHRTQNGDYGIILLFSVRTMQDSNNKPFVWFSLQVPCSMQVNKECSIWVLWCINGRDPGFFGNGYSTSLRLIFSLGSIWGLEEELCGWSPVFARHGLCRVPTLRMPCIQSDTVATMHTSTIRIWSLTRIDRNLEHCQLFSPQTNVKNLTEV